MLNAAPGPWVSRRWTSRGMGNSCLQIPEDRRSRFPVRLRRSEGPQSSPRSPRVFHVGILWT